MTVTVKELREILNALTPGSERGGAITGYSAKLDKEIYYFKGRKLTRNIYSKTK